MENEKTEVLKYKIQNQDLVELGFPQAVASNTYHWTVWSSNAGFEIIRDFYNALYTLIKIYERYTSKKLKLSENSFTVFLNDKEVFSCYVLHQRFYKHQDLKEIKEIINELLSTKFNNFEELQQEFAEVYEKEKAKSELNDIEIYNWSARFPTEDEQEEYEKRKNLFIEALKSDKEFTKKEVFYITKPKFFGENYLLEKSNLKLKDVLKKEIAFIRLYQNLLVLKTPLEFYAVELNETEKHKIFEILTLLKI